MTSDLFQNINFTPASVGGLRNRVFLQESELKVVGKGLITSENPAREIVAEKYGEVTAGHVLSAVSCVEENFGAVNLSLKDGFGVGKEKQTLAPASGDSSQPDCTSSDDKFAGSLLYKIMTDPKFVENIRHDKEVKKLTCRFCKKKFDSETELQDHLNLRMNDLNQITCCACGKTFGQKRYLRYHQRYHVEKNKFTCGFCSRKYSRMDNLARHKNFHTNPNKYPCIICKKSFTRRDLMTKHVKSHEGKTTRCNLCEKNFTDFDQMKAHVLIFHTKNDRN